MAFGYPSYNSQKSSPTSLLISTYLLFTNFKTLDIPLDTLKGSIDPFFRSISHNEPQNTSVATPIHKVSRSLALYAISKCRFIAPCFCLTHLTYLNSDSILRSSFFQVPHRYSFFMSVLVNCGSLPSAALLVLWLAAGLEQPLRPTMRKLSLLAALVQSFELI